MFVFFTMQCSDDALDSMYTCDEWDSYNLLCNLGHNTREFSVGKVFLVKEIHNDIMEDFTRREDWSV